jgi:hypothetical protein
MAPGATKFHENRVDGRDGLFEKGNDPTASLPRDKAAGSCPYWTIKGEVVTFFKPLEAEPPGRRSRVAGVRPLSVVVECRSGDRVLARPCIRRAFRRISGFGVTIVEPFVHLS